MSIELVVVAAKSIKDTVANLLTVGAKIKDAEAKKALLALDGQLIDLETKLLAVRKENVDSEKKLFEAEQEIVRLKKTIETLQAPPADEGFVLRKDGAWEKDGHVYCPACYEKDRRRIPYEISDIFMVCPRCKHERVTIGGNDIVVGTLTRPR